MIELYGTASPNVTKVIIMLEEIGLPYLFHDVNVLMGDQFSPEFGELTPNRKVPVIVDSNGPGGKSLTLWESGAILIYLAEKTGQLLSPSLPVRYNTLQWLMFQMAGIGPMFGQQSHFRMFAPEAEAQYGRVRYDTEVLRLYDVAEARLSESPYLADASYSVADVAAWPWLKVTERRGVFIEDYPNVRRWIGEIAVRPAVQRSMQRLDAMATPSFDEVKRTDPESLDRYFGRGRFARGKFATQQGTPQDR